MLCPCILSKFNGPASVPFRSGRTQQAQHFLNVDSSVVCSFQHQQTGYAVGGVCPFGVKEGVSIYLDESLKRFSTVLPAAGSSNSCVEMTCEELERYSRARGWVDVCKDWDPALSE